MDRYRNAAVDEDADLDECPRCPRCQSLLEDDVCIECDWPNLAIPDHEEICQRCGAELDDCNRCPNCDDDDDLYDEDSDMY